MGRLQFRSNASDNGGVGRGRRLLGGRFLVAAGAVGMTVALAQEPVLGAFTAVSGSSGNSVSAAAEFCATPGSRSLNAVADSWVNEQQSTWTGGGDDYYNLVRSQTNVDYRTFVRFETLPTIPPGCALSSASLRLYTDGPSANRTLDAYLADPNAALWTETSLSWATQPVTAGTPAPAVTVASNGYVSWNVTGLVATLYTVTNNGFAIRDRNEGNPTGYGQQYIARQGTYPPKLDVAWN
jgi:hypothetical protein